MIVTTTEPPYYAVIFTSERTEVEDGYGQMSEYMAALALQQPGYLGHESAREGLGITISYWDSLEAIKNWKQHSEHLIAQDKGISQWYTHYKTRICKVERDYDFHK